MKKLVVLFLLCSCMREPYLRVKYVCGTKTGVLERKVYNPHIWCNEHFKDAVTELLRSCKELTITDSYCGDYK